MWRLPNSTSSVWHLTCIYLLPPGSHNVLHFTGITSLIVLGVIVVVAGLTSDIHSRRYNDCYRHVVNLLITDHVIGTTIVFEYSSFLGSPSRFFTVDVLTALNTSPPYNCSRLEPRWPSLLHCSHHHCTDYTDRWPHPLLFLPLLMLLMQWSLLPHSSVQVRQWQMSAHCAR